MRKGKIDLEMGRKIALTFPGVEEGTAYGSPAFKLRGKLLACIPTHRSAEPGSLVVCVNFEDRDALIAEAPDTYYCKEHYINYRCVLVRLSLVTPEALRDLLGMAYKFVLRKAASRSAPKRKSRNRSQAN